MSNTVMIISLVIGLIASLIISTKFNINAGILGLIVAWIVGGWMGKLSVATLVGYWPTSVMFIAITTTLFFGVARENGTLTLFANKVILLPEAGRLQGCDEAHPLGPDPEHRRYVRND